MKKKIAVFLLMVIIVTLLCACEVDVRKEDTGKYFLYENNVQTDTWIEFKQNRSQWKDSDGNSGNVTYGSDSDQLVLYNNKTEQDKAEYVGYLFGGRFSFYKGDDWTDGKRVCRDFYSDKYNSDDKDSSQYSLTSFIYSTIIKGTTPEFIYGFIVDCYVLKGYRPFREVGEKALWVENDTRFMSFMVRECDETKDISLAIATDNPESSFLIKDGDGNIVFTAKDYYDSNAIRREFYDGYEKPTITFITNQNAANKFSELYEENPLISLQLFIFGEYARDLTITTDTTYPKMEREIVVEGENVGLLAKDVILTQLEMKLSLVIEQRD